MIALFFTTVLPWLTIGLGSWAAVVHLVSLVRSRRPPSGAHVMPRTKEPVLRRDAWSGLRYSLLPIATAVYLLNGSKYGPGRWLLLVLCVLVAAPDVISWTRSRVGRKPGGPTAEPS